MQGSQQHAAKWVTCPDRHLQPLLPSFWGQQNPISATKPGFCSHQTGGPSIALPLNESEVRSPTPLEIASCTAVLTKIPHKASEMLCHQKYLPAEVSPHTELPAAVRFHADSSALSVLFLMHPVFDYLQNHSSCHIPASSLPDRAMCTLSIVFLTKAVILLFSPISFCC